MDLTPQTDADVKAEQKDSNIHNWLLVAAVAVVGCIATLSISYTSYDYIRKNTVIDYQSRMTDLVRKIQSDINLHTSSVQAVSALFDVSGDISKQTFSKFSSSLRDSEVGIIAYGWAPKMSGVDPQEYAKRLRAFDPDLEAAAVADVDNSTAAPKKYPVLAIEPDSRLEFLRGKDLAALPSVVGPLQDSIDFEEAWMSGLLQKFGPLPDDSAVMVLYPHYKSGAKNFLVDQRRENAIGIIFALLDIQSILNYAIKTTSVEPLISNDAIAIRIENRSVESDAETLFKTYKFDDLSDNISQSFLSSIVKAERYFDLGGRPMRIEMLVDVSAFGLSSYRSTIATLLIGLVLTLVGCLMVSLLVNRERSVKELVVDRTKALRLSEERFRDMADVSADWFWEMDADLRFSFLSDRFEDVTGLQRDLFLHRKRSEVAGVDVYDVDDAWRQHLDDLEHQRAFSDFRYTMPRSKGRRNHFSISGKPVYDTQGTFLGYRGTGRDVTLEEITQMDLRNSESRLQRYVEELEVSRQYLEENTAEMAELAERYAIEKERAEASEKSKSEFLASMSHEIRTPMTGVMGFADMLLDSKLGAEDRDKVIKIKGATQSLLSIINDILDLSKLEAGRVEIENLDFNLRHAIEEVLDLVNERARTKDLELRIDYPEEIPDGIYGDPTRIRQILINLVGNAVKFTSAGHVTIAVRIEGSDDLKVLRISVIDTGIGISKENAQKLFSDFSQADSSISRRYEGTGLGLSISKRLVELMGGGIWVESDEGIGSEFSFRIPYHLAQTDVSVQARHNVAQNFSTTRPLNILVAEDNRLNQRIISATLEKYGHKPTIVENGVQAVEAVEKDQYDLILMDIRMPEMSGPEATRAIRSRNDSVSRIPIIALTADAMEEHIRGYMEDGMDACTTKPIDRSKLLMTINEVLGEEIHVPTIIETVVSDGSKGRVSPIKIEHASGYEADDTASVMDFLEQIGNVAAEIERSKGSKS